MDSSCAAEFNLTVINFIVSRAASPDKDASSNCFGAFLSAEVNSLAPAYIPAPTAIPLVVANNFSSSAVRNCAVPPIAANDPAPLNQDAIDISLAFSLIVLNAVVMSALITSNFLGSAIISASFLIASISSSTLL